MTTEGKGPIVIPCYLVDGVPYVLEVDANGKLAVRAAEIETLLGAGLPAALDSLALKVKEQSPLTGFATSAKQDTMITALQLIDDLRAALLLVGTDRLGVRATELETLLAGGLPSALSTDALKVREQATLTVQAAGGDKIISLESVIGESLSNTNLTAGANTLPSASVPSGKLWVVTCFSMRYISTTISMVLGYFIHNGAEFWLLMPTSLASNTLYTWDGWIVLDEGDYLQVFVNGATAGDDLYFHYLGYQMDAP